MVTLGPGRDKELGVTEESTKARVEKIKKLAPEIGKIATFIAEGQGMVDGLFFPTGSDLAYLIADSIQFGIVTLMEQGYISKKLPTKAASKEPEPQTGQYL